MSRYHILELFSFEKEARRNDTGVLSDTWGGERWTNSSVTSFSVAINDGYILPSLTALRCLQTTVAADNSVLTTSGLSIDTV